jgi:hypothetical protein
MATSLETPTDGREHARGSEHQSRIDPADASLLPEWVMVLGKIVFLMAAAIVVSFLRRPGQFRHPYIWIEEGTVILKSYAERGLRSFFDPLAGYFVLVPKSIALLAFRIDILAAPYIAAWLMVVFTGAVVVAIALSPTALRARFVCALMPLLVPTHPEVFAVSQYSLWWAGLLVALAVLWKREAKQQLIRAFFIFIGGFSSPLVVPAAALLIFRAAMERTRSSIVMSVLAVVISFFQLKEIAHSAHTTNLHQLISIFTIQSVLDRFLGFYIFGGYTLAVAWVTNLGLIIAAILGWAMWKVRSHLNIYFYIVVLLWMASVLLNILRLPPDAFHPIDQARYFFYPDTFLAWACVWIATFSVRALLAFAATFVFALASIGTRLSQGQVPLDWRSEIRQCAQTNGDYTLPIMYLDSIPEKMWKMTLTGDQCRTMIAKSLLPI